MRNSLLILLLLNVTFQASAQNFHVRLQSEPIKVPKNLFYISKVHDDRVNKADVGFVFQGANSARVQAIMDIETTLGEYLTDQIPSCSNCLKVEMYVVNLQISEKLEPKGYRGDAQLEVLFLIQDETSSESIATMASASASSMHENANSTHDKRIRDCLEDVINQLSAKLTGAQKAKADENMGASSADHQKQLAQKYKIEIDPQKMMRYHKQGAVFLLGTELTNNRYTLEQWLNAENDSNARWNIQKFNENRTGSLVFSAISGFCIGWVIGTLVFGEGNIVPMVVAGAVTFIIAVIFKEAANKFGTAIADMYNLKLGMTQVSPGSHNYTPTLGLQFNLTR